MTSAQQLLEASPLQTATLDSLLHGVPGGLPPELLPGLLSALPMVALSLLGVLYILGVARAWRKAGWGRGISVGRASAGLLGLMALGAALSGPLEALAVLLFSAHMAQHLLLSLVAAPLLVLGVPLLALLWLLPPRFRRTAVKGWRRSGPIGRGWRLVIHPVAAWLIFVVILWAWHLPAAYGAALTSELVHVLEHLSLLGSAGLFWWMLFQPLGRRRLNRFLAPVVLFVTALQGGVLGAMITLAPEPWYGHYERVARATGISALADQQLAGLLMWVPPGALYLGLACWMLYRALAGVDAAMSTPNHQRMAPAGTPYLNSLVMASALAIAATGGFANAQVLRPAGPAAQGVSELFWVMLIIAAIVCVLVYALLFTAIFRRRIPNGGEPPLGTGPFVVLGGIVLPIVILVPLLFWSLALTAGMVRPTEDAVTIEVIGHQWWWEVRYPEVGVTDANEIHIPAGRPVRLQLTSDDVIHSFWAPGLQGKMDLVPGTVNTLWIEADETGIHSAKCAEFCGTQHANMRLLIVSEPQESFDEWLQSRTVPPQPPLDPLIREGQQVFLGSACVYCHTIEGTNASGRLGPDLTHLATRMTLGAGTVANNRGNLGGWIVNSQAIKPGNRMPPMYLESEDLQVLLAYLESLE
ncbi:MAG: cytochrome c oxidase subunit II [Trueperaceae bacterium]